MKLHEKINTFRIHVSLCLYSSFCISCVRIQEELELLLEMVSLLQRQVRNPEGSIGGRNFSKLLPMITESLGLPGFRPFLCFLNSI